MKVITVNPERLSEKPMRNILGMNNIPRISTVARYEAEAPMYEKLNLSHIRFHDAPLENPSFELIDISRIFPLFHADENDARNYCFEQTDDYMKFLVGKGAEIDFRLGETIDHSGYGRKVKAPADADKWARICRNIIAHYKAGEMGGMHLNIKRVSVFEETNGPKLFDGTPEQYAELFAKAYKLIKRDFPDIKVGGPCCTAGSQGLKHFDNFLTLCEGWGVRPDFTSSTIYAKKVEHITGAVVDGYDPVRKKHGIEDVEHIFVEWHYAPDDWNRLFDDTSFFTAEAAAFSAGVLTALMDVGSLGVAYYYAWSTGIWAPHDVMKLGSPYPSYYALLFFQRLATECERLEVSSDLPKDAYVLAGKTADGKTRVLLSCHDIEDERFRIEGLSSERAVLKKIDMNFKAPDCTEGEIIYSKDGSFEICHKDRHGVYLLEI